MGSVGHAPDVRPELPPPAQILQAMESGRGHPDYCSTYALLTRAAYRLRASFRSFPEAIALRQLLYSGEFRTRDRAQLSSSHRVHSSAFSAASRNSESSRRDLFFWLIRAPQHLPDCFTPLEFPQIGLRDHLGPRRPRHLSEAGSRRRRRRVWTVVRKDCFRVTRNAASPYAGTLLVDAGG